MSTAGRGSTLRSAVVEGAVATAAPILDSPQLSALRARYVGPVEVSGRVTAIDAVASHPEVIFVGAAAGGIWKSTNAGLSWEAVFDSLPVASIGALAVFQAQPEIVWAGTGEANLHVTVAPGDGVYRSTDGGRTWSHLGLADSGHIARIVLHPSNPDVAWVAAAGPLWRAGGDRGVYKTDNAGKSWSRVLFADDATGAGDLALDPGNPQRLLANLWQVRRWPWKLRSGGPGSGLYLSEDGGRRWTRLTPSQGLPWPAAAELGRMKLAFAPSRPEVAYAMVEIERAGVLLRSADGGRTWAERFRHPNLFPRPFYFGEMKVDPRRPDRLYSLHLVLDVSNDGGKSWDYQLYSGVHPDMHALWIDPRDPDHLLIGTDGGLYVSRDGGQSAAKLSGLPLTQFNRIALDSDVPYHVYGGTQDNGSWRGPAASWETGGIYERAWSMLGGDDGSTVFPDPAAPGQGYAMAQNGELERWDLATGQWQDLRPRLPARAGKVPLRFGWVTPLVLDPLVPGALYCGSQFVLRSTDRGHSWTAISPDLTSDDPAWQRQDESGGLTPDVGGAEAYATISTLAPSSLSRGLLWAGTDDGRIQLTRDGGATWSRVGERLAGAPAGAWVARILASRFAAGAAYVLLDDHRRGDERTLVYLTEDYGATWRRLPAAGVRGFARAIEQDPVDPALLFLGTESGLWLSRDAGASWLQWPAGPAALGALPPAPVADLAVHPRDHDLVVATHGRGIYIVDDVSPLRHIAAATLAQPLHLFAVADTQQHWVRYRQVGRRPGPRGEERPYGALLTFWFRPREPGAATAPGKAAPIAGGVLPEAEIVIAEAAGRRLRSFTVALRPGLNRAVWGLERDLRTRPPRAGGRGPLPAAWEPGPEVPPGSYQVTVRAGGSEVQGTVRVLADPRSANTAGDWRSRWEAQWRIEDLQQAVVEAVERLRRARADLAALRPASGLPAPASGVLPADASSVPPAAAPGVVAKAGPGVPAGGSRPLLDCEAAPMEAALAQLEGRLILPPRSPLGVARHNLTARLADLEEALASSLAPPTPSQAGEIEDAESAVASALAEINRFFDDRIARLRSCLAPADPRLLAPEPPLALPPRPSSG